MFLAKRHVLRSGAAVVMLVALTAGCDSGPSDTEFITACLAEGERGRTR